MNKSNYSFIADGVLRSSILTVVLLLIFSIVMTFKDLSSISSTFYLVTTILSVMYGSIFAVKKINKKGWLVGILVALLYMTVIYIVSILSGNTNSIEMNRVIRLLLALVVGALSGIIGINI
ncbi:hypothetical protein CLOACE_18690 [Clostridium acetireducens DSM 10703]|uniref:TIGR04086 family membrane protein n=2 Tax=Clostridium TaxID=1485 RepID=A0A1E8EWV3_9CLOT|nr:hypothetical protein CLOACE_18690 [Clostridium acetireducens DSM 10703]